MGTYRLVALAAVLGASGARAGTIVSFEGQGAVTMVSDGQTARLTFTPPESVGLRRSYQDQLVGGASSIALPQPGLSLTIGEATLQVAELQDRRRPDSAEQVDLFSPAAGGGAAVTLGDGTGSARWGTGPLNVSVASSAQADGLRSSLFFVGDVPLLSNDAEFGVKPDGLASLMFNAVFTDPNFMKALMEGGTATGTYSLGVTGSGLTLPPGPVPIMPPGPAPTPEPAAWAVWLALGGGLAFARRRRLR